MRDFILDWFVPALLVLCLLVLSLFLSYCVAGIVFNHFNASDVRVIEELKAEVQLLSKKVEMLQDD